MEEFEGHIVDIPARRVFDGRIVVENGIITDIVEMPVKGSDVPYIMPGFIDSHVHIESTLLIPGNFARIAVHQGTVAAVCDPHEIANVLGRPVKVIASAEGSLFTQERTVTPILPIPELKITDKGLFNVADFNFTSLYA